MAYLGNQPVVGDSTNTFKLLDDIASFTLTFDGSSASVVSVANDTLTFTNHRFITGQRVTYGKGGGTVITGLTDATAYFIIKVDQNTIKLATNASNAASSTAIDLTGVGAGTSHTLKVAFDGVNTKFKATHSNGTKSKVSRAAQISLSINGVIQQPTEANPPTVGYGIEPDSTIVFSTAPVSTDKVFGSFIGEVAPSFDITDNTVNNFTGDGSTTTFNLSKEIPSNNDVLVTLDGVTQYPSDASTTRAYSVIGSSLVFVSAPADGVAIQARLIGFAGATTSEVTGFYGRTGNAALKSTDDITFQNASAGIITASQFVGFVTATDVFVSGIATFASDVGIAGTLTYEDVTNIDSVGIITARSNILVGTGITLSPDGDVFVTGISTFSGGIAGDVSIGQDLTFVRHITLADKIIHNGDTDTMIRFPDANTITAETAGSERVRIASDGKVGIGQDTPAGLLHVSSGTSGDCEVIIEADTDGADDTKNPRVLFRQDAGVDISSVGMGNNELKLSNSVSALGGIVFETGTGNGYTNATERLRITSEGNIYTNGDQVRDSAKLTITDNAVGVATALHFHNSNGSGNASAISCSKGLVLSADVENNSPAEKSFISFETDATERLRIDDAGLVDMKEGKLNLSKQGAANYIEIGAGQNANNYAYIDLIGDTTYTDYGFRIIRNNSGANTGSQLLHRGTGPLAFTTQEASRITFQTAGTSRMDISSDGYVTTTGNPYFSCTGNPSISSNIVTSFANVHNNNGSHYNNTTGKFTAPVAGFYFFAAGIWQNSASAGTDILIQLTYNNGSTTHAICGANAPAIAYSSMNCSGGVYMVEGGTVYISATGVSVRASTPRNYFSGYLVG